MKPALAALPAALLLTACADGFYAPTPVAVVTPAAAPLAVMPAVPAAAVVPADTCFRTTEIRNHTVGDSRTLYLRVAMNDVYRLETAGACATASDSTNALVIRTTAGSGLACRPVDLDLGINRSGFVTPCIVTGMMRLTPAEVAALPAELRP